MVTKLPKTRALNGRETRQKLKTSKKQSSEKKKTSDCNSRAFFLIVHSQKKLVFPQFSRELSSVPQDQKITGEVTSKTRKPFV